MINKTTLLSVIIDQQAVNVGENFIPRLPEELPTEKEVLVLSTKTKTREIKGIIVQCLFIN